jgi:hypothetical protein
MRMTHRFTAIAGILFCMLGTLPAHAQHLWWDVKAYPDATCLYGEITVLATHHAIYYCGANWHPGEPAGGYCGIQHNSAKERRTIFSIWDTSPQLHPSVSEADAQTIFNRFGGEGEGAHTHMRWNWQSAETFQFFVQKQPGQEPDTTAARYYVFDRNDQQWRHSATIVSPNGDDKARKSVSTVGGGLASFLENFAGRDADVPKLALYRLWVGTSPDKLVCLTVARGDGQWGTLHDAYFLAEGNREQLDRVFDALRERYGAPRFGKQGERLDPISDRPLSRELIAALKALPRAPVVARPQ